ncbi:MAG TPA: hypothetical protein VNW99_06020 [Cytophagaceae bacterium]|nr:hypothetical protein [Cytophagaceae bacterium]
MSTLLTTISSNPFIPWIKIFIRVSPPAGALSSSPPVGSGTGNRIISHGKIRTKMLVHRVRHMPSCNIGIVHSAASRNTY